MKIYCSSVLTSKTNSGLLNDLGHLIVLTGHTLLLVAKPVL